jgi:hypothetical protein
LVGLVAPVTASIVGAGPIVETGSVVSGSGAAAILTGDTTTATVCYNTSKNTIKNAKGTTVDS